MAGERRIITVDGNEAAGSVAYRASEVIAIYPITPSSPMGESSDEWSADDRKNIWGTVPRVIEMQSEAGVAGAVHGALQAGALATTFTASQGLLLMIPNMYKIAGELTPFAMHVTARTIATHALSIFGDHSDVMACRQTGFALLCSGSVQEAHDMAAIAHAATLASRVPFLHFFDGFRTSHEIGKIEELTDGDLRSLIDDTLVASHRARALSPDHPVVRGTAQNPDTYFQAREACNPYYDGCPAAVQATMDRFAALTGRRYKLFDYVGHPRAERVIVIMGSGAEVCHETVEWMLRRGERVGVVKVRLYRPFSAEDLVAALPRTVRAIAVLDRTKEPGSADPLYLDVVAALRRAKTDAFAVPPVRAAMLLQHDPVVVGGRYGLSSKEFTPAMVKAVFDELVEAHPKPQFTVGITDDVTHLSLAVDPEMDIEPDDVTRAVFYGLGADGTVGANKNSIKIIGEHLAGSHVQGYFVYDSKKSGAVTVSHLRFGERPIRSSYLIRRASFVACHQFHLLEKVDVLACAEPGGVFLVNAPFGPDDLWDHLPAEVQQQVLEKALRVFAIDANAVAAECGLKGRINTIMQTCFFAIADVMPVAAALDHIRKAIAKTYGDKGEEVVRKNYLAVDRTIERLAEIKRVPSKLTGESRPPVVGCDAPDFVRRVTAPILAGKGDELPVSAFAPDGTWPLGTTRFEKRNLGSQIPAWDEQLCIQCNKCALVCPHAAIRAKVYPEHALTTAPETFKSTAYKAPDLKGNKYTIQVAPEDCTGCTLCVAVCPAVDKTDPKHRAIDMVPQAPLRDAERENFDYFLRLPEVDRAAVRLDVKGSQLLQPLFEFSGACSGCGETPYVKLLTQLFGDRTMIANATGCSSIYGASLPTTPYCTNRDGRGPAWANSLFEDNAEFGLGMRLALDKHQEQASELLKGLASQLGENLVTQLLTTDQKTEAGIVRQRGLVAELHSKLSGIRTSEARRLAILADYLVRKTVWIVGGDGWAYDIGFGGVDHVLASGRNVNILVLDTEVYSNTGGQQSKSTPLGAAAKFAVAGKTTPKKDLALMAMTYGTAYVARVAVGAKDVQTVKALLEAESYDGPSLVIAYSHCIAHGYDLGRGVEQQKLAVDSGYWPIFRFDPRRIEAGENPLQLDSPKPKDTIAHYAHNELRFRSVEQQDPARFAQLMEQAQRDAARRIELYEQFGRVLTPAKPAAVPPPAPRADGGASERVTPMIAPAAAAGSQN